MPFWNSNRLNSVLLPAKRFLSYCMLSIWIRSYYVPSVQPHQTTACSVRVPCLKLQPSLFLCFLIFLLNMYIQVTWHICIFGGIMALTYLLICAQLHLHFSMDYNHTFIKRPILIFYRNIVTWVPFFHQYWLCYRRNWKEL